MHEVSLAREIVDIAAEAVRNAGANQALAVTVRVGELACVAPGALRFAFEVATRGTILAGAELRIQHAPLLLRCDKCRLEVPPAEPFKLACPHCGEPCPEVTAGRELEVVSVECPGEDREGSDDKGDGVGNAAADCRTAPPCSEKER